jgi:hypothetical protein
MNIILTKNEIDKCKEFSVICAENQQEIEFGQSDTNKRSKKEIARDNLIGKLAEVAFAKMLKEKYDIVVDLDFNYYPRGVWDHDDVHLNDWLIDIKATRPGSEWMLIEWSKLRFRKKEDKLSHIYIMAEVGWDREADEPLSNVRLVGYAYLNELAYGKEGTYILRKGKILPRKSTELQADNFGRPFRMLNSDWDELIKNITEKSPPNTRDYKVPN